MLRLLYTIFLKDLKGMSNEIQYLLYQVKVEGGGSHGIHI